MLLHASVSTNGRTDPGSPRGGGDGLRAPVLTGALLSIGLVVWTAAELGAMSQRHRAEMRRFADSVFLALEMSATPPMLADPARLEHHLERLAGARPRIRSLAVWRQAHPVSRVGEMPSFDPGSGEGEKVEGETYYAWRRLGGPPRLGEADVPLRPPPPPRPRPGDDLVLLVGLDDAMPSPARSRDLLQIGIKIGVGGLSTVAIIAAWILGLRERALRSRLRDEKTRRSHLEELSLAASGLAHETKNPLGIIRGLAQRLVQSGRLDGEARDGADQILEEADRAAARLDEFMSFARVVEPEIRDVAGRAVLEKVAAVLEADAQAQRVVIRVEGPMLSVRADGEMLLQIVLNLALNALQASAAGDEVVLKLSPSDPGARLRVVDRGRGIDPELGADVLKPYVTGRPDGHGLGLAIVRKMVEQHGWSISIDSVPNRGTTVTIDGIERGG